MTRLRLALLAAASLFLVTASCSKKDDPAPTPGGLAGILTWTVNSGWGTSAPTRTNHTATAFSGTVSGQSIYLTAVVNVRGGTDLVSLDLPTGGRPGTFELGYPGYPGAYVTCQRSGSTVYAQTWSSVIPTGASLNGKTGEIIVRTFDERTRTLNGTFEYHAFSYDPVLAAAVPAYITGTFDLRY